MKFKIFSYDSVDSTNDIAIKLIKTQNHDSGFVHALSQKKGKGRYGKRWISKRGNFFGTFFFHLKKNYPSIKNFTFISPKLNIDFLSNYCNKNKIFFKSPNDIYVNKKKICGILQEVIEKRKKKYLIIGIGINLISNPRIKNYPSTNIFKETKKKPNMSIFLKQIVKVYEKFLSNLYLYNSTNIKKKLNKMSLS